jgi:hypothetical protein
MDTLRDNNVSLVQGFTHAGSRVAVATKLFIVTPRICGSSVWNFLHVNFLAPMILGFLIHFWKMCASLM